VETKTHLEVERYVDLYRNVEARSNICIMDPSQVVTPLKPLCSRLLDAVANLLKSDS